VGRNVRALRQTEVAGKTQRHPEWTTQEPDDLTLRSSKTKPAIRAAPAHVMLPLQITRGARKLYVYTSLLANCGQYAAPAETIVKKNVFLIHRQSGSV
jgi:hypothetical protein